MKKYICLLILFPLSSFAQEKDSIAFDFGFTRGKDVYLWPLIYKEKNENMNNFHFFFSLYRNSHNYLNNTQFQHLLPLYVYRRNGVDFDRRFLSIYYPSAFRYSRKKENDVKTFQFLSVVPMVNFVEVVRSHNRLISATNLFPIVWYRQNKMEDNSHLIIFPIYFETQTKNSFSRTVFPFYSYGKRDSTYKYFSVTPFHWQSRERHFNDKQKFQDESSKFNIHPILYQSTNYRFRYHDEKGFLKKDAYYKQTKFNFIPLLYFFERTKNDSTFKNSTTLFPLYWHRKTPNFQFHSVMPVYGYGKSISGKQVLAITPLFWNSIDAENNSRFTMFLPLAWKHEKPNSFSHGLLPVYGYGKSISGKQVLAVTPLFWNSVDTAKNSRLTMFLPLVWKHEKPNSFSHGFLPVYGYGKSISGKQVLAITPLFWNSIDAENNSRLTMFLPLAWKHEKPNSVSHGFLPIYGYSQKHYASSDLKNAYIFPIFWNSHNKYSKKEIKKTIAFPIWWSRTDTDGNNNTSYKHRVLFPLYWQFRDSYTVFPFFSYGREHLGITPLFWNVKNDHSHTQMLIPLYYFKYSFTKNERCFQLFPFVWTKQNDNYRYFHFLPFYSQLSNNESTYRYILGPLFAQQRTGTELRHSVLWVLFQWNTKDNEEYQRRILYRFLYSEKWDGVQTFGLMPFFHISKSENNGFSKNFGFGFYSQFRRKIVGYENEFYEETRMFWFLRVRSNYQYLKNKGINAR